jgi:D-glycero-D-manno-heptose 1,7-bisphosphate phosphatase
VTKPEGSPFVLKTVFLDRDGVINRKMPEGEYVTSWEKFVLLPGVPAAIGRLKSAGMRVIVVTNQRGISLGIYQAQDVEDIHQKLNEILKNKGATVDGFYYCPHDKKSCDCRKPLPGMFEAAGRDFPEIEAGTSVMVGDSLSDIEFGKNVGMRTIFIEGDAEAKAHQKPGAVKAKGIADQSADTLEDAVDLLLNQANL